MPADNSTPSPLSYRGRFAPSPTGPLHMGSLIAAVASYVRARQQNGRWLVRIEDIDPPREVPGAADDILRTLELFGFEWDGQVTYQSDHINRYREVLQTLKENKQVYPCTCSRKGIIRQVDAPVGGPVIYPGNCLKMAPDLAQPHNWRLKADQAQVEFCDLLQGHISVRFQVDQGDFIVWRKEDLPSYQLAVTVDDHDQNITEIVRGADLLFETAGQHLIRSKLGYENPNMMHVPILVKSDGDKLSKQTGAQGLDAFKAPQQLCTALGYLGLPTEPLKEATSLPDLWSHAISSLDFKALLNIRKIDPVSCDHT